MTRSPRQSSTHSQPARVVVVGAGYAGITAANRVARRGKGAAHVTLINPTDAFVERIRLHQHASCDYDATRPLRPMLAEGVQLRVGHAYLIVDAAISLADGQLEFDHCIVATGSEPLRGLSDDEHQFTIGDLAGAQGLRERIQKLTNGSQVVVVGSGLAAIETTAEIAEQHPNLRVSLAARDLGADFSARARSRLEANLARHNVSTASTIPAGADCLVWAIGDRATTLAADSGLPVDATGRVLTTDALVSVTDSRIVATGDAAAPPLRQNGGLRPSCQAAITGRAAAWLKEQVCRGTVRQLS